MSTKKKLLQAAAGSAGGAGGLNVEEVFSTYLYDGTGATQTITNGIDLDGEGGMTWIKLRNSASNNELYDTERGATYSICTNTTNAAITRSTGLTSFNSNGFTVGSGTNVNANNYDIASWTFRKAPKFFDVVTYTGNGTAGRTVSHNLGSVPGCIMVKRTDDTDNWAVYHRGMDASAPQDYYMQLNTTDGRIDNTARWNDTAPTSTQFTVGTAGTVNASGGSYVAYLFAHNDGDGDFGLTGDQDIIKCGGYNGQATVDLGFEPQWLLVKQTGAASSWRLFDNMRGWPMGANDHTLAPDRTDAELTTQDWIDITPTGFKVTSTNANVAGVDMIYIAIRRGPMAVPESATDVFAIDNGIGSTANPAFDSPFPVDFVIQKDQSGSATYVGSRLIGANYLEASSTSAQTDDTGWVYDHMDGYYSGNRETDDYSWMWKRAPSFCDVVAYTGNGTAGRTVNHNLGVAPEMMWVKGRTNANEWDGYHIDIGATKTVQLSTRAAPITATGVWNNTAPTDSVFTVGVSSSVNGSGENYIAYLFSSLSGVSKVGSYTGNGTSQTIDCGFASGARFVVIKKIDNIGASPDGSWRVFDTSRGIVAGNDPYLSLNLAAAEITTEDAVDPNSSGFTVNQTSGASLNVSGTTYIYYAVA